VGGRLTATPERRRESPECFELPAGRVDRGTQVEKEETLMPKTIRDLMTTSPQTVRDDQSVVEAARMMRDHDIGSLIVLHPEKGITGILTDRDIVVRVVAEEASATETTVAGACSSSLHTVGPDASVSDTIELMREHALRRIPVVDHGEPVGIVSIGDLAVELDRESALADISAAPPNT
jgi:CBS domain-containing protein